MLDGFAAQTHGLWVSVQTLLHGLEAPRTELASLLASIGMAAPVADRVAPGFDAATGRCILALYRAARQPVMAEWAGIWRPPPAGRAWESSRAVTTTSAPSPSGRRPAGPREPRPSRLTRSLVDDRRRPGRHPVGAH
jgi:hypothetical protein